MLITCTLTFFNSTKCGVPRVTKVPKVVRSLSNLEIILPKVLTCTL
jgi:hypothetical protein